jgi:hypothetical protein
MVVAQRFNAGIKASQTLESGRTKEAFCLGLENGYPALKRWAIGQTNPEKAVEIPSGSARLRASYGKDGLD